MDSLDEAIKSEILSFLDSSPLCVITTNDRGGKYPESALVAFDQYDNFEIVFETFDDSRKYANLQSDKHVSLVVGFSPKTQITLQYEGIAEEIRPENYEKYIKHFLAKDTPCSEKFLRDLRVKFFKIKPKWLRYSDYRGKTPRIIENKF